MKKLLQILLFVCLLACSTSEPQIRKIDDSIISATDLTKKIESLVKVADVTGIAVAIFNDNSIVYQKSFGYSDYDKKDTLTNQKVFYGASFSKAVFGYLVAQLETEGIIDLDKPLQEYLDKPLPDYEFENKARSYIDLKKDKRYEEITARMCLSHTTGFPNWRWMTRENDFLEDGEIRFLIDPGTRFYYSGEGIQLLQFVIEHITGKELEVLAQEKVFHPLSMNMTSFVWQEKFNNNYCRGHATNGRVLTKNLVHSANAAGSIQTTIEDYSKFIGHILKLTNSKSPVTELLFESQISIHSKTQFGYQAWVDSNENDPIALSYGLGWGLLNSPFGKGIFKEGHDNGFQHYSIIFPEKNIGIVILSNSDNAESIFKELLEVSIGDTFTPWKWQRYIPYNQSGE